uniref:G_PROTEIN_RECEP_F1_2 domain-containing protein n=1 Tax=Heterorhabditis bacteriophora TaxID=37862 RepID=A0A1I7X3C8_HETBA
MFNTSISSMGSNFFADYPNLEEIILRDNSLKRMPGLQMSEEHKMDVEVDLSGNQIGYIGDGRVRGVRARSLRISHNKIKEIAGYAFSGSSFLKLALNGNEELSDLSTDAFKNIIELHHFLLYSAFQNDSTFCYCRCRQCSRKAIMNFLRHQEEYGTKKSSGRLSKLNDREKGKFCGLRRITQSASLESNLWAILVRRIYADNRQFETVNDLQSAISKAWNEVDEGVIKNLVNSMTERISRLLIEMYVDDVVEGENGLYKNNVKEIHNRICKEREKTERREKRILRQVKNYFLKIKTPSYTHFILYSYWVLRKTIWVVWVLAFVGNILVWIILSLAYERRMRVHYLFMINLSIADLITAIQDVRTADEYYRHAVDWQTSLGCNAAGFLAVFASKLSIISMFLIAFEMAYNTRKAFYGHRMNYVTGWGLMVGGWLFSIFMATLPLLGVSSYSATSICLPIRMENVFDRTYIISFLMFNIFAFAGMAVCYAFLICMLKNPRTPSRAEDKDIMLKMALLVGTDMLCRFPTLIVGVFAAMGKPLISLSDAKILLVVFFPINAFANPFLYVFCTKVIQRNVKTKAMPVIRRITSTSGVALNSLSNFYHSQPPGNPRHDLSSSPSRLAVTQVTSLNSTPRESNCSSHKAVDSLDPSDNTRRSSPRVSFQDDFSTTSRSSSGEYSRRSFGLLKRISALPVSAIPEVSDLSEHSSESHHEHIPKQRRRRFTIYRSLGRYRNESARSAGQDSGRGSLTSIGTTNTYSSKGDQHCC